MSMERCGSGMWCTKSCSLEIDTRTKKEHVSDGSGNLHKPMHLLMTKDPSSSVSSTASGILNTAHGSTEWRVWPRNQTQSGLEDTLYLWDVRVCPVQLSLGAI